MAYPSPASSLPPKDTEIEIEDQDLTLYYPAAANDFQASSSTSASADNNENNSRIYGHDVFINHRGPDVKKTFASHLYRRLLLHGVRAFLDNQEMQEGENISAQIKNAIATAAVHVAIFSPGYADSRWCLDELVDMLESKAPIIPVFYKVRPADLRWMESGVYAGALDRLQKKKTRDPETHEEKPRYNSKVIENWRKALASVSEISGFELEACGRDEGELLDKVVERLLKNKTERLYVAKYPTGLDDSLKRFDLFLSQQPKEKPKVAGIVGLGGIGKTTLAKALFNSKNSYYSRTCFLSDIRDNKSLNGLWRKLFQSLCGFSKQIDKSDQDVEMLVKGPALFSKAFLVLDDVDNVEQLDALLPGEFKDSLPLNCLILITSRDRSVLLRSGLQDSSIYKLSGLNTQHSTELFCLHAFCQPRPRPGFEDIVDKFARACNGFPLSLKVFGVHLSGNSNKDCWEYELNRLQRILPSEIHNKLKISFDSLDKEEQGIFLDIACFLVGEEKDKGIKIWDQSGWKGSVAFQNLQNKSLVEVDSENCIYMHDHLRELGREMAENSGFRIPSLWDRTENMNIGNLLQMLKQSAEIEKVRGIRMVPGADVGNDEHKYYTSLRSDVPWFKRRIHELLANGVMKHSNRQYTSITVNLWNLQFLVTEDHLLECILSTVRLPNLRWLRWYKCGYSSLPSWIPMENLRVLHVVGSSLKILWQREAQAPQQLRVLEIWAPLLKFPKSIGNLEYLEHIYINLPHENNLTSLPEEFCQLLSLKRFELINAWKMKSLPFSIGNLTNLEYLNLSFCRSLKRLPNSFEDLISLKHLDLRGSDKLNIWMKTLPRGKERLKEIMIFARITWAERGEARERQRYWEKEMAIEVERERARLVGEWKWEWEASEWKAREMAKAREREAMQRARKREREAIQRAREREVREKMARQMAKEREGREREAWKRTARERVTIDGKWRVEEEEEEWWAGGRTEGEEIMNHGRSSAEAQLQPLQLPRSLQELHIAEFPSTIENLHNLEVLEFRSSLMKMLPSIGSLRNLKELTLVDCQGLKCLPASLGQLTELKVESCYGLVEVGTLPSTLIQLSLISCHNLERIHGLCGLAELQMLNISGWKKVEELTGIETLVSLEQLWASGCEKLKRIQGLGQLTKLKLLDVSGCYCIEELEGVEHLKLLEKLDASDCPRLYWDGNVLEALPERLKEGMLYI